MLSDLAPSIKINSAWNLKPFLSPTQFCDFNHAEIQNLGDRLAFESDSVETFAVKCFNWVRDNVKYSTGQQSNPASDTLKNKYGSCSNKANLLIALLRSNGVPSAFRLMRVKTKEYFGPINPARFRQFMSDESNHVYATIQLNGRWVMADPSDDAVLCFNSQHLNPQCRLTEFNGQDHAMLNLDPSTIVLNDPTHHANIDSIMAKKARIPAELIRVFNAYAEFIRAQGRNFTTAEGLSQSFFDLFERTDPANYALFCLFEEKLQQANVAQTKRNASSAFA